MIAARSESLTSASTGSVAVVGQRRDEAGEAGWSGRTPPARRRAAPSARTPDGPSARAVGCVHDRQARRAVGEGRRQAVAARTGRQRHRHARRPSSRRSRPRPSRRRCRARSRPGRRAATPQSAEQMRALVRQPVELAVATGGGRARSAPARRAPAPPPTRGTGGPASVRAC